MTHLKIIQIQWHEPLTTFDPILMAKNLYKEDSTKPTTELLLWKAKRCRWKYRKMIELRLQFDISGLILSSSVEEDEHMDCPILWNIAMHVVYIFGFVMSATVYHLAQCKPSSSSTKELHDWPGQLELLW